MVEETLNLSKKKHQLKRKNNFRKALAPNEVRIIITVEQISC